MDVVHFVDKFPIENSDLLGGNAANNMTVLRQFEDNCELFEALSVNDLLFNK